MKLKKFFFGLIIVIDAELGAVKTTCFTKIFPSYSAASFKKKLDTNLKGILIEVYGITWYNFHSQMRAEGVGHAAERN